MPFAPTTPVTGAAQTGFTTPTYTIAIDTAPDTTGKQYAVTAIGGTQTGVDISSVSRPFTSTFWRPKNLAVLPKPDVNGVLRSVPVNKWSLVTRKGATPLVNQQPVVAWAETRIMIPAGTDISDTNQIKALLSAHIGVLNQQSAGIGDTVISGVM